MTDHEHDGMKKCTKCGEWKPATAEYFYAGKKYRDGFRSYCRGCLCQSERRYREENKEKIAEQKREYRKENRDKIVERQLEYSRSAVGCLAGDLNRIRRKTGATIYLRDMTDEEKETLANQCVAIKTLEKTEKELLAASGKKRCKGCGRVLDYCFFYRHHSTKDGLGSWCKECRAEYRREYHREYYQKNKEHKREYYQKNKDYYSEYQREYRKKNEKKHLTKQNPSPTIGCR